MESTLIISTGDICNVDGLLAIALYARSGADLLFVMNFPAYLDGGTAETEREFGLGYDYDTNVFLDSSRKRRTTTQSARAEFTALMDSYTESDPRTKMKDILTDLAFHLTSTTWTGAEAESKFYFAVGGVNDINPYSSSELINEVQIYCTCAKDMKRLQKPPDSGNDVVYDLTGNNSTDVVSLLQKYNRILMDFNGSAAFLDSFWYSTLLAVIKQNKVKALFVQGGVLAYEEPHTVPKLDKIINRLGCATMNQLYSPLKTGDYLRLMEENSIPVFIIPNNCVENLQKNWAQFFAANAVDFPPVSKFTDLFYTSDYHIAAKPYDLYSAVALLEFIRTGDIHVISDPKTLFFNSEYAVSLIHNCNVAWDSARDEYIANMTKKLQVTPEMHSNFLVETTILKRIRCLPFSVFLISYETDENRKLSLKKFYNVLMLQPRIKDGPLSNIYRPLVEFSVVLLQNNSSGLHRIPTDPDLQRIRALIQSTATPIGTIHRPYVNVEKLSILHETLIQIKDAPLLDDTIRLINPTLLGNFIQEKCVLDAVNARQ